jgi:hypothetical protein
MLIAIIFGTLSPLMYLLAWATGPDCWWKCGKVKKEAVVGIVHGFPLTCVVFFGALAE